MAASVVIPTPISVARGAVVRLGSTEREFRSAAEALEWAAGIIETDEVLHAFAVLIAARRPAARGKLLTIDATASPPVTIT